LVKRVVHALDESQDPDALVWDYFDADRQVVIDATRQTLEATGETPDLVRIEETVDHELIEGLRLPATLPGGVLPWLYVHRVGASAVTTFIVAALMTLALL